MEKLLTTKDLCERWQCGNDLVLKHSKNGLKTIALSSKDYRYDLQDVIEFEKTLKSDRIAQHGLTRLRMSNKKII